MFALLASKSLDGFFRRCRVDIMRMGVIFVRFSEAGPVVRHAVGRNETAFPVRLWRKLVVFGTCGDFRDEENFSTIKFEAETQTRVQS